MYQQCTRDVQTWTCSRILCSIPFVDGFLCLHLFCVHREIYFSKGGFHNVSWRVHDSSISRSVAGDEFTEHRSFNNVEKLDHVKITAFWTQGVALMLPLFESCGEGGALMSHYSWKWPKWMEWTINKCICELTTHIFGLAVDHKPSCWQAEKFIRWNVMYRKNV